MVENLRKPVLVVRTCQSEICGLESDRAVSSAWNIGKSLKPGRNTLERRENGKNWVTLEPPTVWNNVLWIVKYIIPITYLNLLLQIDRYNQR